MDGGDDGFGGRFARFQDKDGVIGKAMTNLSVPGLEQRLADIRKPKDQFKVPIDAGAYWPGRCWETPAAEPESPPVLTTTR